MTNPFENADARYCALVNEEGIRIDGLAQALADQPALIYVMPTYHNPTGTLMSASRRQRIADLATKHGVPLLEDNAYTTLAGPLGVPPPIAAFAPADAQILTIGSLAKAVWAGLRIGWLRAPGQISERLARHKALADLGSSVLDQALAARLFPKLPGLAAARTVTLRHRLDHLGRLLTEHLPAWQWRVPDGGSALWINLPRHRRLGLRAGGAATWCRSRAWRCNGPGWHA